MHNSKKSRRNLNKFTWKDWGAHHKLRYANQQVIEKYAYSMSLHKIKQISHINNKMESYVNACISTYYI